jgi:replicative DNA helicase
MTTKLKLLANELGICVVLAAQLNREAERRADKRPIIADLRESGNIEQDSDVVILLHDESKHDEIAPKHILELIIAKNRHGAVGNVRLIKKLNHFRLLDRPAD